MKVEKVYLDNIMMLIKLGQYGEVFKKYGNIVQYSNNDELVEAIKRAQREKEQEDQCMETWCNCCSGCMGTNVFALYCVGFMGLFCCCGEDVAEQLCLCDCFKDMCTDATKGCLGC